MGMILRALASTGNDRAQSLAQVFGAGEVTTPEMQQAINEWTGLYLQRVPDDREDPCMRLPYAITHKLSKTVFAEYDSGIADAAHGKKAAWMDENRRALDKQKKDAMQWALVGGAVLLKPVPDTRHFHFGVVRRDAYAVLGRGPGKELTDVACAEYCAVGRYFYTLAERRTATPEGVALEYRLYRSTERHALGQRVPLTALNIYANLVEHMVLKGVHGVGLAELRMPMANCIDGSADGMCIYEPAVGLIHNVNRNERQLDTEFENGRSRVFASQDLFDQGPDGTPRLTDDVFATVDASAQSVGMTVFNPTLRGESYETRKQGYLKACENLIGLKRGILSDVEAAERTATEITSSAGDYSMSIIDLQNVWFDAMREALVLCDEIGKAYRLCDATPWDTEQLSVSWGNGVLYDARTEWQDDLAAVQAGLLRPEIALAHRYDLPCETPQDLAAIRERYMPEMTQMMT